MPETVPYKIRNVAHRGASAYEPENTLRAFDRAIELGADMIEIDVHLSADSVPVVIHDYRLSRITDGSGWVKRKTLAEIKELALSLARSTLLAVRHQIGRKSWLGPVDLMAYSKKSAARKAKSLISAYAANKERCRLFTVPVAVRAPSR